MARDTPKLTLAAFKKACFQEKAALFAEGLTCQYDSSFDAVEEEPPDLLTKHCRWCNYSGSSQAVWCHEMREHEATSTVLRCIDTNHCTVCNLGFEHVAHCIAHVQKSELCSFNLLMRGTFQSREEAMSISASAAEFRRKNLHAGNHKMQISKHCVRRFGPIQQIVDTEGNTVKPSRNGHPLGPNRPLFLPSHLLVTDDGDYDDLPCIAARYADCSTACLLCKGNRPFLAQPA